METRHRLVTGDAREMAGLPDGAVELVVTSPPYPMIEMWDGLFARLDDCAAGPAGPDDAGGGASNAEGSETADDAGADDVGAALARGDGDTAFERMHALLDEVWRELARVVVPGGIVCVNVGDATRSIGGSFQLYPNHARVVDAFRELGFDPLPDVLWRKPTNSANKFMGSGMLPPNAYVTLEHEYVLVFRNGGGSRSFPPHDDDRYDAAFFWEERNDWFSDVWTDVGGTDQQLVPVDLDLDAPADGDREGEGADDTGPGGATSGADGAVTGADGTATGSDGGVTDDREAAGWVTRDGRDGDLRERSGAFPLAIPYRLVNMYSVYGDTVLDPFAGTGTTGLAAAVAGRNSVGYELDPELATVFDRRLRRAPAVSRDVVGRRLADHAAFVEERRARGDEPAYESERYGFPVVTRQESSIRLYTVDAVEPVAGEDGEYLVEHTPVEADPRVDVPDGT